MILRIKVSCYTFFCNPDSGSASNPDFIDPLYGLSIADFVTLFLTQLTSNWLQFLPQLSLGIEVSCYSFFSAILIVDLDLIWIL